MELKKIIKQLLRENLSTDKLQTSLLTKDQMIKLGASGSLTKGFERYIPVNKIVGEDDEPKDWTDSSGNVNPFEVGGKITSSIEVIYDSGDDSYYLQNGNHRLKQAKMNGDEYIRAFVQPDRGKIGDNTLWSLKK